MKRYGEITIKHIKELMISIKSNNHVYLIYENLSSNRI